MLLGQSALLGIGLLLTGLVFVLLVGALLRFLPRLCHPQASTARLPAVIDLPRHNHAILVVRSGGRVEYVNPTAREWFELRQGEEPNLEALARRVQPGEDLLKLCAAEGRARFSFNGRPLEGVSYQIPGPPPAMLVSFHRPNLPSSLAAEGEDTYGPMLGILAEFSQAIAANSGLPATLKAILENVERLIPADLLEIKVWNAEEGRLLPYHLRPGPGGERHLETGLSLLPAGYTAHLAEKRQALFIPNCQTQGQMKPIRSYIGLPLLAGGELAGTLEAGLTTGETYTSVDLKILQLIAGQACTAIRNSVILEAEHQQTAESENVRLFAETRRLAEELEQRVAERTAELAREKHNTETLLRVLSEVSASLDLDQALNRTLALLNVLIGAQQGSVLLLNAEDNMIHYRAGYGYKMPSTAGGTKPTALKIGEGVAGWVIENREAVLISDVRKDVRWVKLPLKSSHQRSVIAAPLVVGEEVIGVIMAFHPTVGYFTPENMKLVQAIGSQVAEAINNAQLYALIRDQAERLGNMLRSQQVEASRQQAILEAVADGVLVTDANNEINFINSSAERILGLQAEMTVGRSLENFVGLFGKTTQTWTQTIRSWSVEPTSYHQGDTYAEQLTLENGRVVLVHLAPVIWRDEFLGTVSIFRDITHEVEVDRLKSEFVATVSHELRTPMTSIKGYVDLLLMGACGALDEKQTRFLEIVRSNTERLSILVNDLLDISRIEVGRVSLLLQPIDLREVAEDVIAEVLHRSRVENKPMGLSLDAPPDLPRVYGDLERVNQILGNMVVNAYHYTPENGRISIRLQTVDGEVQVDVVDNGIGIPPADQERVFERFFRGEDPLVLATPGTGLGLSIVKQLVKMHKGRIWITSTGVPGEGSTFSFTLPLYQVKE